MNRHKIAFMLAVAAGSIVFAASSCNKSQPGSKAANAPAQSQSEAAASRIAYVDIDSFEANYEGLKKKKDEFKVQQESMENELQRSAQQFQSDYANVMRKQQEGTLSRSEAEAAEKRLSQMQQSLETRRTALSTQFQNKLDAFNKKLHDDLDSFLTQYTKEHQLDYVLSYSRANSQILYANKSLNITEEVIKGMNERAKSEPKSK
jgi:outer membrane protein